MEFFLGNDFKQVYADRITGGGSFSYSADGKMVTALSPTGANNGVYKDYHFLANSGDEIEFGIYANVIKGEGVITVDLKDSLNMGVKNVITVPIKEKGLKLYKFKARIPEVTNAWASVAFSFGVSNAQEADSEVIFTDPFLSLNDTSFGNPRTIAMGMLKLVGNTVVTPLEIVTSYRNFGIKSASFDPTTKEITVTLDRRVIPNFRPIIQVTATYETNLFAVAGGFANGDNPTFKVTFVSGTSRASLSSGTFNFFVEVKV